MYSGIRAIITNLVTPYSLKWVQQLRRYDGTYRLAKYALLRIPATVYHVHIALPHIITLLVILFFRGGGTNINSLYAFTLLNLK